ncbi:MAG: putative toxin-antitoxin system toxin component, PIN family [Planctomycetes bacterium]|nr:putative toxin-antitoxin system toxin component, PIN family [Planctomycetota bacterium]
MKSFSGASNLLLKMALKGELSFCISHKLFLEYCEVTERENLNIEEKLRKTILEIISFKGIHIEPTYKWRPFLRDENDNFILELAVSSNSNIVTHNIKDFKGVENKFNIKVLKPEEVLK